MANPVPILFTIPNFITAGSGRAMLNIIERLDRNRFAPSVCVSKKGGDLEKEVERQGIPLLEAPFTVPARPYSTLLWRAWQAARTFRAGRYKLWHSFHYLDDYTEPIIARLAGAHIWVYTKKNMNWWSRAWYIRTTMANYILAQNTDMVREFFSTPRFSQKVALVPRGVDTIKFCPGVTPLLQLKKSFSISDKTIVVGTVSHLIPVKGHPVLLRALAMNPNVHLMIAGKFLDQEYVACLHELAGSLGLQERVYFLGDIKEVQAFLAEIDLFILPTLGSGRMEGCPVALLEAMACGKACIATDIPGSRDVIEHGKSGILVPPEDPEALAAAMKILSESQELRHSLGQGARQRILERFTIEREVADHVAIYEELLKR